MNLFAPHDERIPRADWASEWLYSFLGSERAWLRWLPHLSDAERSQMSADIAGLGSYSVRVPPPADSIAPSPALRVISINMNYCHDKVPVVRVLRVLVAPLFASSFSFSLSLSVRV